MKALIQFVIYAPIALSCGTALAVEKDYRPYVKCVQESLTILRDYNPRGVDGSIGPGTRGAAAAYATDHTDMELPEFTAEVAEVWCRKMANAHPDELKRRVVIATELPDDDHVGLRVFGGSKTEYIFATVDIDRPDWTWADIDGRERRVAILPRALLSFATYFCLDAYGDAPYRLLEKTILLKQHKQRDGITGTHPNYMGICRWRGDGTALSRRTDIVSVNAGGDLVLRYRVEQLPQ